MVVVNLIFTLIFMAISPNPLSAGNRDNSDYFVERQPEDNDARGSFSSSSQIPDIEPGEIENRGNFGENGTFDEEQDPNDADTGGGFGDSDWKPNKRPRRSSNEH